MRGSAVTQAVVAQEYNAVVAQEYNAVAACDDARVAVFAGKRQRP